MNLFRTASGEWVTQDDLRRSLGEVNAAECDLLYVHSEMSFGTPNPDLKRKELLGALFDSIRAAGPPTIVMPTFTFSFCNGEPYDRQHSRSEMGALNEFVRTTEGAERSSDPLMSVAVFGREKSVARNLSSTSLGRGSTFDKLHALGPAVRFLFLGVDPSKCFTYIHYVEKCLEVPYRYDRTFSGTVIDDGRANEVSWTLFVRYAGVEPTRSSEFTEYLSEYGALSQARCGDAVVSSISEPAAYAAVVGRLEQNIDYLLETPYPRDRRDTSFQARKMVAL